MEPDDDDDPYFWDFDEIIGPQPEPRSENAPPELLVVPQLRIRATELERPREYAFGQYLKVYHRETGTLLREGMVATLNYDTHIVHGGNLYNNSWEEHQVAPTIINIATQQREQAYANLDAVRVEVYIEDPEATIEDPDMTEADASNYITAPLCSHCRKSPRKYECTFDCGELFCSQTCFESSLHMFSCSVRKLRNTENM